MYFDSRRSTVLATNGMVATSQPLAAMSGLQVLMDGGNATDAAITAAATLNVVEPNSTGVGGDLFALVWNEKEKSVRAINGSGRAAAASNIEELTSQGYRSMPGAGPVLRLRAGHGSRLGDAAGRVRQHAPVTAAGAGHPLRRGRLPGVRGHRVPVGELPAQVAYLPVGAGDAGGRERPEEGRPGEVSDTGRTLRAIAEGGCEAFYHGPIAEKMASFVQEHGGWLTTEDLAAHTSDWDEPITTDYRGVTCWECPPNGQGIAALEALNIAEGFDIGGMGAQSPDAYHHLIEAMRLAFADAYRYVADPRMVDVPTEQLVSKEYAAQRRELMDRRKAMATVPYGQPIPGGNTVYVSAVDGQGNACSLINSIFSDFGSGMVAPGTGIVLHNRAGLFSLDAAHPNALAPGKRPYHTIIPGLATKDGELLYCYGMMGAFMQPQGHLQLISNMVDHGMDPQQAINALRFMVGNDQALLEEGVSPDTARELQLRGHKLGLMAGRSRVSIGGAQVIARDHQHRRAAGRHRTPQGRRSGGLVAPAHL